MQKITESQLLEKVKGLREYLVIAEAPVPGMGQKGPTVAAAQGKDPSNPLNQAPAATPAPYNAAKDSQAANVAMAPGAGAGRGGQGGPTAAELAGASAQAKWPTSDAEIKAFQKANGLTPDGMIGSKTLGALKAKGFTPPAGFVPVGNKAPAAPAAPAAGASAQATPAAPAAPAKPAEVPYGINPETGEKYTSVADAPLELPPGAEPEAGMTVAGSKPAAGASAQAAPAASAAPAAPAKPAGAPNPWAKKDPAKAAAWAKLSPEDQKWLGGADPTDQFILGRAPNKGKPAAGASAQAAPQRTAAEIQASKDLGNFAGESVGYSEDQALARIIELARR